jgi:hypothetical protein
MKCSEYTVRLFDGAMTLSIKTFSLITLGVNGLFVTFSINDTQLTTLCHYTECHYAKCHVLFIVMLSAVMLGVIVPCVAAPFCGR